MILFAPKNSSFNTLIQLKVIKSVMNLMHQNVGRVSLNNIETNFGTIKTPDILSENMIFVNHLFS